MARSSTTEIVELASPIVTVCCEIVAKPGAAACTAYVPGATSGIENRPCASLRAVFTRPGSESVTEAPATGVPSLATTVPVTSTVAAAAVAAVAAQGINMLERASNAQQARARTMSFHMGKPSVQRLYE